MITINLIAKVKKKYRLPVVLGVDLNTVNFKAIILALIVSYSVKFYMEGTWEDESKMNDEKIQSLQDEQKKYDEKIKNNKSVRDQLDAYTKQVQRLKDRSLAVESVLKKRNNPRALFERLARNTPADLWLTSLNLDMSGQLEIKGRSMSYKSIGDFSVLLGESKFFQGKRIELKSSETIEEKENDSSRRLESFTLGGKVDVF